MPMIDPRPLLALFWLHSVACSESPASVGEPETTGGSTAPDESPTAPEFPTTTTLDESSTTPGDPSETDTTGGGVEDTTIGAVICGDGIVGTGEECDDGDVANHNNSFCTDNCNLNVCGDGHVFVGWELCDEGAANSDAYGSLCGEQCEPGGRCGDGKLQPEFETCDLGLDNGSEKGDEQGILCDATCRAQRLRGFITADAFSGDLDGLFGADLKCRAAAQSAGLAAPERFHAYLSTGVVNAKDRFAEVTPSLPYVAVTGKKFAESFTALLESGPLGEGISVTEHGASLHEVYVATNTAPGGLRHSPVAHCQDWTSASDAHEARAGLNALPPGSPDAATWKAEQWWVGVEERLCHKALFHLYCLEI